MDKKVKQRVWCCEFSPNVLGVKEVRIEASCVGNVMIKLHDYLKPDFIAEYLFNVSLLFEYE